MKVALVTGAGSGIGRATARALLGDGYSVVLAGRTGWTLEETADGHGSALVVPTDVTSSDSVRALFTTVRSAFGRIDVLFNNAGIVGPRECVDDVSGEAWDEVIATNLRGQFLCAREAFRLMKDQSPQGGRIINNGSVSAQSPRPNSVAYTASKHGVLGLTKSISLDGRMYKIACSQLDIGNAASALTEGFTVGSIQADASVVSEPVFDAAYVAQAIMFMVRLPLEVNVQYMTLIATTMPLVGRG